METPDAHWQFCHHKVWKNFLKKVNENDSLTRQVISIGAGYDTVYFNLCVEILLAHFLGAGRGKDLDGIDIKGLKKARY